MEFMLLYRFDQNGLLRQTLLRFFPKNCGICCDKVSKTFSYECFCQNQRSRKSSSHLSSLKTSLLKRPLSNIYQTSLIFKYLAKQVSHLICFFLSVLEKRHICNEFIIQASGDVSKPHDVDLGKRLLL